MIVARDINKAESNLINNLQRMTQFFKKDGDQLKRKSERSQRVSTNIQEIKIQDPKKFVQVLFSGKANKKIMKRFFGRKKLDVCR